MFNSAQSSYEQLDDGEKQPSQRAFQGGFEVFGEASVTIEPSKGALDDPAPRQNDKPQGGIGALDDLDPPPADFVERGIELGAAIAPIGKDVPQPGIQITGARPRRAGRRRGLGCRLDEPPPLPASRWCR